MLPLLLLGQGAYYAITGVWPLIHMRSFLWVTGPKTDLWLVRTVGVLILVIGATLTLAGIRRHVSPETATLAIGSALALTAVDIVYVAAGRISKIYLLDAAAEVALLLLWGMSPRSPCWGL